MLVNSIGLLNKGFPGEVDNYSSITDICNQTSYFIVSNSIYFICF